MRPQCVYLCDGSVIPQKPQHRAGDARTDPGPLPVPCAPRLHGRMTPSGRRAGLDFQRAPASLVPAESARGSWSFQETLAQVHKMGCHIAGSGHTGSATSPSLQHILPLPPEGAVECTAPRTLAPALSGPGCPATTSLLRLTPKWEQWGSLDLKLTWNRKRQSNFSSCLGGYLLARPMLSALIPRVKR